MNEVLGDSVTDEGVSPKSSRPGSYPLSQAESYLNLQVVSLAGWLDRGANMGIARGVWGMD